MSVWAWSCALAWVFGSGVVTAQDMEPRRWTHLPVGTNVFGIGYVYTHGDLKLDPTLGLEDAQVDIHTAALSFNHYFSLFGQTARVDLRVPVQNGRWDGLLNGSSVSTRRNGVADPRVRLSVNLFGAPALEPQEFLEYRKEHGTRTTVGAALAVTLPLGKYEADKLINLGQNRFTIRPQFGVLHTRGPWSFELSSSVFVYTDNDDFFNGNRLAQDPLYETQVHVVRTFESFWVSAGLSYAWGAETEIEGERKDDVRSNLLSGISFGLPIGRTQSVKMAYIRQDALEHAGTDSDSLLVSWAIRF